MGTSGFSTPLTLEREDVEATQRESEKGGREGGREGGGDPPLGVPDHKLEEEAGEGELNALRGPRGDPSREKEGLSMNNMARNTLPLSTRVGLPPPLPPPLPPSAPSSLPPYPACSMWATHVRVRKSSFKVAAGAPGRESVERKTFRR